MNPLKIVRSRFAKALTDLVGNPEPFLGMIRAAQDPKFGDFQANFAMAIGKQLGRPPREVADEIAKSIDWTGLCSNVEVAGPGFINLTLDPDWIKTRLRTSLGDERLGVELADQQRTFVVDFSSPNVAKPMHVGHIRSTVIGDSISRILRFAGHKVITDNHLGDWGTQFGMIIYGYKHFRNEASWKKSPVRHLGELYRKVRQLIDYHDSVRKLPELEKALAVGIQESETLNQQDVPEAKAEAKEHRKRVEKQREKLRELEGTIADVSSRIKSFNADPSLKAQADAHPDISKSVLDETAALHSGDEINVKLWNDFLPFCQDDIERVYKRLNVTFDQQLGESFYHDQLASVVEELQQKKISRESEGATCVFLDGFETPMIVRKRDGAFLYSTTDLATIRYRMQIWQPDEILYVVDHRQHEHFDKLFAAAKKWGWHRTRLYHVSFGTVLGDDGRPFKTRSGDTVGLEGLLDEAEEKARGVLRDLNSPHLANLNADELEQIAKVVGIGALKYADLSQNRASDYKFSYEKMLELKGNTATYLQYLYARVQGVFREGNVNPEKIRRADTNFIIDSPTERQLAIMLIRFSEMIDEVLVDYRPNILAQYMFELAQQFFRFYDQCHVLKAESEELKASRLALCDITARTIKKGLELLNIGVVDRM